MLKTIDFTALAKCETNARIKLRLLALGNTKAEIKSAYQSLFHSHLSENTIQTIRDATNKAWALGDESLIKQVSNALSRRAKPSPQGGDRRSNAFNKSKIK